MDDHTRKILQIAEEVKTKAPLISYDYPEEDCYFHSQKKELIDQIKKKFYEYLGRYSQEPDYLISIRWFYTQKLIDFTHLDPLIPRNIKTPNVGLIAEMTKLHALNEDISAITKFIFDSINSFKPDLYIKPELIVRDFPDRYSFHLGNCKFNLVTETYTKLSKLYIGPPDRLNNHIFNLLCRYESLAAPGYHAAIPDELFNILRTNLSVNHELFASPFNCNMSVGSYTSAYPDTDKYFGSKGNFFNVYPKLFEKGGSFEANPPFLEEHVAALSLIIEDTLKTTLKSVPLSFVVVYPSWTDSIGYQILHQSKFNITTLQYEYNEHYYVQSSQYWLKNKKRTANNRSSIFILQNEAGKIKYKVTPEVLEKINESFKC